MTTMIGHVENPSAKIQFAQVTMTAPGSCATCGSGQDENGFIDTGLDFEYWGRVYFCSRCALELASVFGFISPDDYADLEAELNIANYNVKTLTEKNENLEQALAGLSNFRSRFGLIPTEPGAPVEIPTKLITDETGSNKDEPGSTGQTDNISGESKSESSSSNEPTSGQSGQVTKPFSKPGLLNI